jgi:hypothetical protein
MLTLANCHTQNIVILPIIDNKHKNIETSKFQSAFFSQIRRELSSPECESARRMDIAAPAGRMELRRCEQRPAGDIARASLKN